MTAYVVLLPCRCSVVVDHEKGDRAVVCDGGGLSMPDGEVSPTSMVECPGGRGYKVTAELIETVRHLVTPMRAKDVA
jgi:hypothetical protein